MILRLSTDRIAQEIIMSKRRPAKSGQTQASPRNRDEAPAPARTLDELDHRSATVQGTPPATNSTTGGLSHDRIAARAYELWEARGRTDGSDLEDWFKAEKELSVIGK